MILDVATQRQLQLCITQLQLPLRARYFSLISFLAVLVYLFIVENVSSFYKRGRYTGSG